MSGNITKSVVNGATWSGISQVLGQGLRFISLIILARILSPDDFGLVAMVTVVTSIAMNLVDGGFIEVVIQRKDITEEHLVTLFWVILFSGTMLCIIVTSLSPVLSTFFNNSRVGPLMAVSSSIFVIQSTASVHSALLRRRLQFFKLSIADIGDSIGYMIAALPAAYLGLGVWSMVIGNIASTIPGVALRWRFSGWRPYLAFNLSSLKDLWKFGVNNLSMRMVGVVIGQVGSMITGRFLFAATLGFYAMASRITTIPSTILGSIGNRVALPALALVQDEPQRLQRGLLRGEAFLSIIGVPIFIGLAVIAPELIMALVGSQWIPLILPLRILCISGCISILNIGIPALFLAKGRPDIDLKLSLIQLALLIPALLIGVRFGLTGVSIALSAASVVSWLMRQIFVHQVIKLSFKEYLLSLQPAFLASTIMAAIILAVHYALITIFALPDVSLLIIEVLCGAVTYIAALKIGKSRAIDEIINLLTEMVKPYGRLINIRMHSPNRKIESPKDL